MKTRPLSLVLQILLLAATAAACAVTVNMLRPEPLPWVEAWSERLEAEATELGVQLAHVDEVYALYEEGAHLFFDARPAGEFEAEHIPGAYLLPSDEFDLYINDYLGLLYPEQPILVYCSGEACDESIMLSENLIGMGFTNIVLFENGMKAWTDAGHPVEEGL